MSTFKSENEKRHEVREQRFEGSVPGRRKTFHPPKLTRHEKLPLITAVQSINFFQDKTYE